MLLTRFVPLIYLLILSVNYASSSNDISQLREHFITNLIEETRGISSSQLTDDIERTIKLKIEGFLNVISEPSTRSTRDTNDLLLNEKTTDVFVLKGFESRGFVPVNFPRDICMFQINRRIFAVGLSHGKVNNGTSEAAAKQTSILSIFMRNEGEFHKVHEYSSTFMTGIDCEATSDAGYVAVVNTITEADIKGPNHVLKIGSFILQITLQPSGEPRVDILQKFAVPNQNGVRLYSRGQNMYLIYSYNTLPKSPLTMCTIFKLTGTHFNPIDDLPCQNARVIEFFTVHHDLMVLIGNYQGNNGTTSTFSSIMRFDLNQRRFIEHQKIFTNAIAVGRYFYRDHHDQREHFLFIGNSFEINEFGVINYEIPSLIYKLVNGFFVPMQTMNVKHVQAVLPLIGKHNEFHLLVASEDNEVQIYFFDGWKFQESSVDFTGDAFGAGVVAMRAYDDIINGTTTVVISNRDSFEATFNVYTPIYAVKNDTTKLKSSITKWCTDTFNRLEEFNVDDTEEILNSSLNLANPSSDHASFMGKVYIRNSTIKSIKANQIRGKRVSFNNGTARRVNSLYKRFLQLSTDVNQVNKMIRFTKATQRTKRQAPMLIRTLTVDESINIETINGRPVADLVYKMNRRNQRMKSITAHEILARKEMFVDGKIDGLELSQDNVILNVPRQVLRPLTMSNLTVKSLADVNQVNTMPFPEFLKMLRRKVDRKFPTKMHQLEVDKMTIGRFLNGRNFTALSMHSLKTKGDQIVTGSMSIGRLKANKIIFQKVLLHQRISGVPLAALININDTRKRWDINQDVRFTESLQVNRLFIIERINNINVKKGQLQVLRKRGPSRQVVTGEKFFDDVQLLSPIVLQGKIESKTLEIMNPLATVTNNLVLQGDYKITGPVTIRNNIVATGDIVTSNFGLKKLLETGLNLFSTKSTNNNLVFENVVEVKQNLQAVSLNQKQVINFVKLNHPDMQTIRGKIIFKSNLMVHGGTVQADIINDVNINQLNKTVLKRSSIATQFIDGNVELVSLQVEQLRSLNISVNGKQIDLLLNTNTKQDLKGLETSHARVRNFKVINMHQDENGKIFGHNLNFLIDDTVTKETSADDGAIAEKKFSDLKVEHLMFAENNEWKSIIKNFEGSIAQDLNITDDLEFTKEMRIGNLIVTGTINDISYDDMLNNWLQLQGDQIFTAPQTFTSIDIDNNLLLPNETVNGVNVGRMVRESIWIDEPIYVENTDFKGDMLVHGKVMSPSVNGINLSGKLILNNTNEPQTIKKIEVDGTVAVEYLNFTHLNGIDCEKLTQGLAGNDGAANLHIRGGAVFNYQPNITSLNNENLKELYESIWISDRDVELTGEDIQFLAGVRSDNVIYADTLNEKDLDYYYQNYFSLTQNQNIGTHLTANGTLSIKKAIFVQKTIVSGAIKLDENDNGLNIDEFSRSILRLGQKQKISGHWTINKIIIEGDYNGTINGLNFHDDVLHAGNKESAVVTGRKVFQSMDTYGVNTHYVNDIDVADWFENAIFLNLNGEQVIEGKVELGQAVFYDDVQVFGTVNEINFNPETVLTKSGEGQVINGDLTIITMSPEVRKQLFIENLYLLEGINGKNLSEIYANTLKRGDTKIHSKKLLFEEKLVVDVVETTKDIYGVNIAEFLAGSDASHKLVKFQSNLEYLTRVGDNLKASAKDVAIELTHFEDIQSLNGVNIQKTVQFTIRTGLSLQYIIAVHERNTNTSFEVIKFYRWIHERKLYVDDGSIIPLQYSVDSYQITRLNKIIYKGIDHLYVEIFDKTAKAFFQSLMLFDPASRMFIATIRDQSPNSALFFTLNDGLSSCYGSICPSFVDLRIVCEGTVSTVLQTAPMRMVSSQNDIIILLTDDHQLQIWHQQKIHQVLNVLNPQSFSSIAYNGKLYLAVTSDKVEQSIHHGSIEIFESGPEVNFVHVQTMYLENPFIVQFSVIPSGDLLLYVLTRNPGKALSIYKYAGASYFVESIGSKTTINSGNDLSTIRIDDKIELIAIASNEVFIIEAVLKEY